MAYCQGTLSHLRPSWFSQLFATTSDRIYTNARSIGPYGPTSTQTFRALIGYLPLPEDPCGIGSTLNPVHFLGKLPRAMNCYILSKGWGFLFIPFACFRQLTQLCAHTECRIRDLNRWLGCYPFGDQAYPGHPV